MWAAALGSILIVQIASFTSNNFSFTIENFPEADTRGGDTERIRQFGTSTHAKAFEVSADSINVYVTGQTLGTFPRVTNL
jgi:hypothetical protein